MSTDIINQDETIFKEAMLEKHDPRGKKYYWIGGLIRWHGTTILQQLMKDHTCVWDGGCDL